MLLRGQDVTETKNNVMYYEMYNGIFNKTSTIFRRNNSYDKFYFKIENKTRYFPK